MSDEFIGSYRLIAKIGEGGMGEVYQAIDDSIQRKVAVKFLRADLARNPDILDRFRQEAQVLGSLNHPNIAALYNFGREGERWYMAMELTDGQPLENIIHANPEGLKLDWALFLFRQALVAIKHAHEFGVVHRDIKPANMMVNSRAILKVLDFGIARVLGSARMTRLGTAMGTATYMSPEQVLGDNTDERSDIYSLAVVLYEMLTGKPPFARMTEFELMTAQVNTVPESMRGRVPAIPEHIDKAVLQALAKAPADRFQSAHYFLEALGRLPFQMPTSAPPLGLDLSSASRTTPLGRSATDENVALPVGGRSRENPIPPLDSAIPKTRLLGPDDESRPQRRAPMTEDSSVVSPERDPAATRRVTERIVIPWGTPWPSTKKLLLISAGVTAAVLSALWLLTSKPVGQDVQRARELIAKSEQALAADRVLAPFGDNAVDYLEQAIKLIPNEPTAIKLAQGILNRSVIQGNEALKHNAIATAKARRNDAQQLVIRLKLDDKQVADLGANIQAAERSLAEAKVREEQRVKIAQQIADLLGKAKKALTAGNLNQPKDANAIAYARQVLTLSPDNAEAKQILVNTVSALVKRADDFLRLDDLSTAVAIKDDAAALIGEFKLNRDLVSALEGHVGEATRQQERLAQQLAEAAALETRVNALVNQGQVALKAENVDKPVGSSAVDYARQALAADPKSSQARKLAEQVVERLVDSADKRFAEKALDDSEALLTNATGLAGEFGVKSSAMDALAKRIGESRKAQASRMAQEEKQVQALLTRADEALRANRYTEEGGALTLAAQVLKLRPSSEQAFDIVVAVETQLESQTEAAIEKNDLDLAERTYRQAMEVISRFGLEKPTAENDLGIRIENEKSRVAQLEAQRSREAAEQQAEAERKSAQLKQLVERAKAALATGKYVSPPGENAADLAAQVLDLEANNAVARTLLTDVIAKVLAQCRTKMDAGNTADAKALLDALRPVVEKQKLDTTKLDGIAEQIAQMDQRRTHAEQQRVAAEQAREQEQAETKAKRDAELNALAEKGRLAVEQGRLTSPAGDNALVYAERLLQLQKSSTTGRGLLNDILVQTLRNARKALDAEQIDEASQQRAVAEKFASKYALDTAEITKFSEVLNEARGRREAAEREKTALQRQKQAEQARSKAEADAEKAREATRALSERNNQLLDSARTSLAAGHLVEPAGDSVMDYTAQVLKTDAKNREARQLMEEVVGRLVAAGELALSRNNTGSARQQLRNAEAVAKRYGLSQSQIKRLGSRLANAERPAPVEVVRPTVSTPLQVPTRALARLPEPTTAVAAPLARTPEAEAAPAPTPKPAGSSGNTFVPPSF